MSGASECSCSRWDFILGSLLCGLLREGFGEQQPARQGSPKDDITKHGQAQMLGAGLVVAAERRE